MFHKRKKKGSVEWLRPVLLTEKKKGGKDGNINLTVPERS